jgi:hypothetical protein
MIEYFALLLSIPLGVILSKLTNREKNIFLKPIYFPTILWVLIVLAAIFLTLDKLIGLSLLFIFFTAFVWFRCSKN